MEKPYLRKRLLKCTSISKIWYGLAIIILQIYVHYDEIASYMEFKMQATNPRYGLQWSERPATFCLMITMISLAMLPFFLYSSLIRTGNLVNDYIRLGGDDLSKLVLPRSLVLERLEKAVSRTKQTSCWKILKYYFVPSCQSLHYVSAFLLLIPNAMLNAEKIKNSAISIDYLWISDLHIIFSVKDPGTLTIMRQESEAMRFPIASINFVIAALFLSIHTSSVFWKATKSFAFLVAIFDIVMSLCYLSLNSSLSVAIQYYAWNSNENSAISPLYSQWQCVSMLLAGFLCFLICRNLVFEFGLQRYMVNQRSFNHMLEEVRVPTISTGLLRNSREFKDRIKNQLQSYWLNGIGFLIWIIEVGCLIPLSCYLVTIYWYTTKLFFIFGFVSITCILVTWFSMWMLLSIKHNWVFKVESSINVIKTDNQPPEPIYTCFHDNRKLSHPSLLNVERNSSFTKLDSHCDGYIEDNKWGKCDLYQLFKVPSDFNDGRVPSVASIPSHCGNDQMHAIYQTVNRQKNGGGLLNGINENRLLDDRSIRDRSPYGESFLSPLIKTHNSNNSGMITPKKFVMLNNSQSDSAYQSYRNKNYSQDSLQFVTYSNRRKNLCDIGDFSRADNVRENSFETSSHNGMYSTKDNIPDDNTDISTDFSDQNTNSSGADHKINHNNRYASVPYHHSNRMLNGHNDEIYLQQTGV